MHDLTILNDEPKLPINITAKALLQFKSSILAEDPIPYGIRIGVKGGGCSGFLFNLEFIQQEDIDLEDDEEFSIDGLNIVIDVFSKEYLKDITLDYISSLKESGFKFTGGKIQRQCGCGSSFSV